MCRCDIVAVAVLGRFENIYHYHFCGVVVMIFATQIAGFMVQCTLCFSVSVVCEWYGCIDMRVCKVREVEHSEGYGEKG